MRTLLFCFIVLIALPLQARLPHGPYYKSLDSYINKGLDVKEALHKSINQHKTLSYKSARKILFGQLHLETNSRGKHFVTDVYCRHKVGESSGVGPGRIPNNSVMNCEHTWPQSRFNRSMSKNSQKTDLHHLFPSDSRANSSRGNTAFGEVQGRDAHDNCQASQRGSDILSNRTSFEPPTEHRGNVARALFYFSVRYKISISNQEEIHLRSWHEDDPVDSAEIKRNEEIYSVQGNRNPFIDEPTSVSDVADF